MAVSLAVENASRNGFPHAQGFTLDWQKPVDRQFPLILGSDVLYELKNHQHCSDSLTAC